MKKTITVLIAMLIASMMLFALVSCDNTGDGGATEVPTSAPTEAPTQKPDETPTEVPTGDNQQGTTDETTKHTHSYTEKVISESHLKNVANCSSKAIYFYSCECGENGTSTFAIGEKAADNHVGTTVGYEYIDTACHEAVKYCRGCFVAFEVAEQSHDSSCVLCAEYVAAGLYNTVIYEDGETEKEYLFVSQALSWNELISQNVIEVADSGIFVNEGGEDVLHGNLVIENGITVIDEWAFSGCYGLTGIHIPDSVTDIGTKAFLGCFNLKDMFIGNGVQTIGHDIFNTVDETYKGSLTNVYIKNAAAWCSIYFGGMDSNPLQFASNLYVNGELVTELVIPEGVTTISDRAFKGFKGVTSVVIPASVTKIGLSAFYGCENLISVTFDDNTNLTTLGENAFNSCESIVYNEYDNACYIGSTENPYLILVKATSTDITSCEIHTDTKFIGYAAFGYCNRLETVSIPAGIKYIENHAFANLAQKKDEPTRITFAGTRSQWNAMNRHESWFLYNVGYIVVCSDGTIRV